MELKAGFQVDAQVNTSGLTVFNIHQLPDGSIASTYATTAPDVKVAGLIPLESGSSAAGTFTASDFAYFQAKPALAFLNTVALLGVDMRLGPYLSSELMVLPNPTLSYCAQAIASLHFAANGYFKAVGGAEKTTNVYETNLQQSPPVYVGGCRIASLVTVNAASLAGAQIFKPVDVAVTVSAADPTEAPGKVPVGNVKVSLDGSACTAILDGNGNGHCLVTPSVAGERQLDFEYSGGGVFEISAANSPVLVKKAPTQTVLSVSNLKPFVGNLITFNVVVTEVPDQGRNPAGSIQIVDELGRAVCSPDPILGATTGAASCTGSFATAGTVHLTARYSGDGRYLPSESAIVDVAVVTPEFWSGTYTITTCAAADANNAIGGLAACAGPLHVSDYHFSGTISFRTGSSEPLNARRDFVIGNDSRGFQVCDNADIPSVQATVGTTIYYPVRFNFDAYDFNPRDTHLSFTVESVGAARLAGTFSGVVYYPSLSGQGTSQVLQGLVGGTWSVQPRIPFAKCTYPAGTVYCGSGGVAQGQPPAGPSGMCDWKGLIDPFGNPANARPGEWAGITP
jgi:hypothetical protein